MRRPQQTRKINNAGWAVSPSLKRLIERLSGIVGLSQSRLVGVLLSHGLGLPSEDDLQGVLTKIHRINIVPPQVDGAVSNSGWGADTSLRDAVSSLASKQGYSASWLVELTIKRVLGITQEQLPWMEATNGRR